MDEWVILGSGTLEQQPDRGPSCHLLRGPGWSLAYTGDSGPCPGIVEAARGVDWRVARHLGEPSALTIVGARDGTSLGLPAGYSHSIVPGGLLEMS